MDEFYNKNLSSLCANEPSPALFAVAANMMCQAAEEAIRKFSVDATARNAGDSQ